MRCTYTCFFVVVLVGLAEDLEDVVLGEGEAGRFLLEEFFEAAGEMVGGAQEGEEDIVVGRGRGGWGAGGHGGILAGDGRARYITG